MQRTASGSAWTTGSSFAQALLVFASSVVITRFVLPVELGRYALVTTVVYILTMGANVYSGGYYVVTPNPSRRLLRSALAYELLAGFAIFLLTAVAAIAYGAASGDEQFAGLLLLSAALLATNALGNPNGPLAAVYTRDLSYRAPTLTWLACFVASIALKIALVWSGLGAWGLIIGDIALSVSFGLAMWWLVRPGRPSLHRDDARELTAWAKPSVVGNFAWTFGDKITDISVAAILGTRPLGLYYLASRLPNQLLQLGVNLSGAFLPAFSRSDDDQLARGYVLATRLKAFFILLPLAIVIPLADEFVRVVYGTRWEDAAIPFALLMVGLAIRSVFHHMGNLLKARGRVRELAVLAVARMVLNAAAVSAGGALFGLNGAAAAIPLVEAAIVPWNLRLIRRVVPFSLEDTFRRPLTAFALATGAAFAAQELLADAPALVAAAAAAVVVFLAFAWRGDARVIRELAASFRRRSA